MKTLALCFNTPGMAEGDWMSPDYGKRFPGAGWLRHLSVFAFDRGISVKAGDMALKYADPKDVIVIQEERNGVGMDLVGMGADPRVLMCLESPIFTPHFYDNVPTNFKHRLLFDGGTEHLYFPSFDDEDLKDPVPWNERKFLCMVTANKHYSMLPKTDSPSFAKALETQLHDYRYAAINRFWFNPDFDLYGRGWDKIIPQWQGECSDKLATIRNYKFALCFENGSYPGYVTEKIIDCLVAGVIPVYRGAPDRGQYLPGGMYVDAARFKDFDEMEQYLRDLDPEDARDMMIYGSAWLKGRGSVHNNRVFAKRILEMCE